MQTKILYIFPSERISGAEQIVFYISSTLDKEKCIPIAICVQPNLVSSELRKKGIKVVYSKYVKRFLGIKMSFKLGRFKLYNPLIIGYNLILLISQNLMCGLEISSILRREKINIVYIGFSSTPVTVFIVAKLMKIPMIFHLQDILKPIYFYLRPKWILSLPDKIITISNAVKDPLLKAGIPSDKIKTIYNGIELSRFENIDTKGIRRRLGLSNSDQIITLLGRLDLGKGHETLFKAAPDIINDFPRVKFLIVGDVVLEEYKERKQELEKIVRDMGIAKHVIFTGHRNDIEELVFVSDIITVPSWKEPFGLVILEAMAATKPVVASNTGGPKELILDKQTGFLVPPRQPKELAYALKILLKDKELRKQMGEAGRLRVERFFSIKKFIEEIYNVKEEVLGGQ